jgi:hypothetical protein
MRKSYLLLIAIAFALPATAQLNITFNINVQQERHDISPYIYGINNGVYKKATWRRWGGNRTSAYNWENNFSNAGHDWFHNNDDYIPWASNLPLSQYLIPASPLVAFHDSSLAQNAMSAITLPMVGYVSRDGAGVVDISEMAPSPRWREVVNNKQSALSLTPDTTDGFIYVDEEMNKLINTFGLSNTPTGIKAYIMDNEPGLWCSQFAHMRDENNDCVTYNELFTKSENLANTIKGMDTGALVFGPESYGFNEYWSLQDASDDANYSSDHWFVDSYLKHMQQASVSAGKRLLDVFSVHWYPDVNVPGIFTGDTTLMANLERMQCPRTLWDSSYTSNSWIGQWFGNELPIIPRLKSSINQWYPGTKFCIDEYSYGAPYHISGGIAQVDALGAFGKTGVDYAAIWTEVSDYTRSAFDLYRDYDGNDGTFGDISVKTLCSSSPGEASMFASVTDTTNNEVHIIVTNKSEANSIFGTFVITNDVNYNKVTDYSFKVGAMAIADTVLPPSAINGNVFAFTLPPLSAHHFVIQDTTTLSVANASASNKIELSIAPNPATDKVNITYANLIKGNITISDVTGKIIKQYQNLKTKGTITLTDLNSGIYFIHCHDGIHTKTEKLIIVK